MAIAKASAMVNQAIARRQSNFSELPFWRKHPFWMFWRKPTKTSEMVKMIKSYNKSFKESFALGLDQRDGEHKERNMAEFLFQVNKIEGEGFDTYKETKVAIAQGALELEGVQEDKRLEAVCCLHRAFRYVYDEAAEKSFPELSLERILESHSLLLKSTKPDIAGRFRVDEIAYCNNKGKLHVFMWPTQVAGAMDKLITQSNGELSEIFRNESEDERLEHLLDFSARLFLEFEHIHPFGDGNGRMGRILVATVLRSVFPFPNVLFDETSRQEPPFVNRDDYLECFSRAQEDPVYQRNLFAFRITEEDVSKSKILPPVDLLAMIVEGVYLGWKRFYDGRTSYASKYHLFSGTKAFVISSMAILTYFVHKMIQN